MCRNNGGNSLLRALLCDCRSAAFSCPRRSYVATFIELLSLDLVNYRELSFIFVYWLLSGGPYAAFGGRDASRGLATFSVTASELEYDDLSDLSPPEMDSVREWEMQFKGEANEF